MQAKTARLLCKKGAVGGTRFDFVGEATLGRDPAGTVVLDSDAISSRHARIAWDADSGGYLLEDLGSLNGTELDGEPLRGSERLGRMHVITLGAAVELIYQGPEIVGDAPAPARPAADKPITGEGTMIASEPFVLPGALADGGADEPVRRTDRPGERTRDEDDWPDLPSVFAAAPGTAAPTPPKVWRLEVRAFGPPEGFALQPGENRVGRLPEGEVVIDGPGISRLHAVLTVDGDRLTVRDAGSRNGTWIDDEPVVGEVELTAGAALRFASVAAVPRVERSESEGDS